MMLALYFLVMVFSNISIALPSSALPTEAPGSYLTIKQLEALRMDLEKLIDTNRIRSEMKDLEDVIKDTLPRIGKRDKNTPPRMGKRDKDTPPRMGKRDKDTPPRMGKRDKDTPPRMGKRDKDTPPRMGKRDKDTPPRMGKRDKDTPPRMGKRAKNTLQVREDVNFSEFERQLNTSPSPPSKNIFNNVQHIRERILNEIIHDDFLHNNNVNTNKNKNNSNNPSNEIGNLTKDIDSFSRETTLMTLKILYEVLMRLQDVSRLQRQLSTNEDLPTYNSQKKSVSPPRLG